MLDAEALRVVNSMPNWTPGKQGGKNVSVRYTLPIQFKLQNDGKKDVETTRTKHAQNLGSCQKRYSGGSGWKNRTFREAE